MVYHQNVLGGAHPIHLHLVPFQVISRQPIDGSAYDAKWQEINGKPPIMHHPEHVPYEPYVTGPVEPPALQESGWKDVALVNAEQVLHLRVRFAPETIPADGVRAGENLFSFDPSAAPGYVWHCHILDHEDNEMMRPLIIQSGEDNN